MAVYTVFEPPRTSDDAVERAEQFIFVRDRFTWSAFIFAPLWMLRHRLWLALVGYVVIVAAIAVGLRLLGVPPGATWTIMALIGLFIGFEGASLRRWTLLRRGWTEHGSVIADDMETAERRFFDAWVAERPSRPNRPASLPPAANLPLPPSQSGIIGLFPEPGSHR